MATKAENAWRTATQCVLQAQHAGTQSERDFYNGMRDQWIKIANHYELLDVVPAAKPVLGSFAKFAAEVPSIPGPDRAADQGRPLLSPGRISINAEELVVSGKRP